MQQLMGKSEKRMKENPMSEVLFVVTTETVELTTESNAAGI